MKNVRGIALDGRSVGAGSAAPTGEPVSSHRILRARAFRLWMRIELGRMDRFIVLQRIGENP